MAKFVLSRKALEDLSTIWKYSVETWSEIQADNYYYMLIDACQELAAKKVIGKVYPEIQEALSGYRIGQHIIFYRNINRDKIEVVRILHMLMDLRNRRYE
ncbi:type II toxin-antitoxin system RelE/ParE family toxin [Flavihumibacter petaseus]|uniref:Toxin n=1 Tax=Flavihumibacter petaseus NBRC 106054 TaxID=1220578 RepID=A0A0E9N4I0_9BACT|nr:type II toxin-antitoxin system RelE/ParE family toxin [Flavihumibacter petaseus]GAO44703.1 putative toxin-antitoxin system toxin component [Flavihumibacter petaseus NBRC 106054]